MATTEAVEQPDLVGAVRASALLGRLPADELAEVLSVARIINIDAGATIRRAGDDLVAVILDGVAIASQPACHGGEVITDIMGPGASCGLTVVLGQSTAGANLTALTDTAVLVLSGLAIRRHLGDHQGLARACLAAVIEETASLRAQLARFAYTSTTQRVLLRLLELTTEWGEPSHRGIEITLPLTQEMLASWARASRESTAKVLQELRRARIIRTGRRELTILDPERLRARCGGEHDPGEEMKRSLLRALS